MFDWLKDKVVGLTNMFKNNKKKKINANQMVGTNGWITKSLFP